MPFVADYDGDIVVPEEVSDDSHLICIDCGDELRVRRRHDRDGAFVARHFWHVNGGKGCYGGESEKHRRLKSIVLSKLKHFFEPAEAGLEKKIGRKIADVYVIFGDDLERFGKGVVCEVQHRNEGKDVVSVTRNYLQEGFSVCWIEDAEINGKDVDLSTPEWFYPHELDKYEENEFLDMKYGFDPETGYPKPPLYCPQCSGDVELEEMDRKKPRGYGTFYGCPQCYEGFINSYYGPVVPEDHNGNRVLEENPNMPESSIGSTGDDRLTCLNCVGGVELVEAEGWSHAYETGQVFECPLCGAYFLEDDGRHGEAVKRVSHDGNLTRDSPPFWK